MNYHRAGRSEKTCSLKEKLVEDLLAGREPTLATKPKPEPKKTVEKRKIYGKDFYDYWDDEE